jgi:hypothetical protein
VDDANIRGEQKPSKIGGIFTIFTGAGIFGSSKETRSLYQLDGATTIPRFFCVLSPKIDQWTRIQ